MAKIYEKIEKEWDKLLLTMKEDFEISDHVFDAFIKNIVKPIKYEKNTLFLEVPLEEYVSFFENQILSKLQIVIAHEVSLNPEELEIVVKSKNSSKNKIRSEEEDFSTLLKSSGVNNPLNTFENFVQGASNSIAYATSIAIAENPGENYNPLYIYSKSGLGKTHLLHAIAIHALQKNPSLNVLFTSCEKFINEFLKSIETRTMPDFKRKYRSVDILLIDDIHTLDKKEQTQEEFFNTFNELYENKKQIILTSDKPVRDLSDNITERLKTRFTWGTTCKIDPPDYETRMAILRKKEENIKPEYPVDNEVIKYIAANVKTNIRELESSLKNIILYSKVINKPIDINLAKERLTDIKNKEEKKLTPIKIAETVCDFFGVNMLDICGPKRNREFVYARDIAIYLCREQIKDITQEKIGEFFGGRDHSTIINSCSKIESKLNTDKELRENIKNLKEKLLI